MQKIYFVFLHKTELANGFPFTQCPPCLSNIPTWETPLSLGTSKNHSHGFPVGPLAWYLAPVETHCPRYIPLRPGQVALRDPAMLGALLMYFLTPVILSSKFCPGVKIKDKAPSSTAAVRINWGKAHGGPACPGRGPQRLRNGRSLVLPNTPV